MFKSVFFETAFYMVKFKSILMTIMIKIFIVFKIGHNNNENQLYASYLPTCTYASARESFCGRKPEGTHVSERVTNISSHIRPLPIMGIELGSKRWRASALTTSLLISCRSGEKRVPLLLGYWTRVAAVRSECLNYYTTRDTQDIWWRLKASVSTLQLTWLHAYSPSKWIITYYTSNEKALSDID